MPLYELIEAAEDKCDKQCQKEKDKKKSDKKKSSDKKKVSQEFHTQYDIISHIFL